MADNKDNRNSTESREGSSRQTYSGSDRPAARHTWIDENDALASYSEKTRVVERQKRPYKGFITDEEIQEGQRIFGYDPQRIRAAGTGIDDLSKTRVYDSRELRTGGQAERRSESAPKSRYHNIRIADRNKFRRLVVIAAVILVLLACEIGYAAMRTSTAKMPARAEAARKEAAQLVRENKKLDKESAEYGDYEQKKELRESWERLRDRLSSGESE